MSSKSAAARIQKHILIAILRSVAEGTPLHPNQKRRARYLLSRRYIHRNGAGYSVSSKGERYLAEDTIWSLTIPAQDPWEGKWHIVLFDIPKDKRKRRDTFRLRLKELGFIRYQDSVWVYPFPVEDTIRKIAGFYGLTPYVSYVTADSLTDEKKLLRHFNVTS